MKSEQLEAARQETQYIERAQNLRLREGFWTQILSILRQDCTQSCINSEGTRVRLLQNEERDCIIIEAHLSSATLKQLLDSGYMVDCTEEGRVRVESYRLGGSQ